MIRIMTIARRRNRENLHRSKLNAAKNTQTVEDFVIESPNRISKDENDIRNIENSADKKDKQI